jgi:hypothetical protein
MGEFPQNPQAVRLEHWATDAERCSDAESGSDSSLCAYKTGTRPGNNICGHPSQIDQSGVGLTT